jgi:hypothetical protein
MSSPEDEVFRRLIGLAGMFEESEEVHKLVDRIIDSPDFPDCQTPEEADRMLAKIKQRILLERAGDAVESDSEGSRATVAPKADVAPASPRDRAAPENDRTRPPTRPEITLAASTSDEEPPTLLAGVVTGPDGRDEHISLKVIDRSPEWKLAKCMDFNRIAEELNTTDLGLFISGEYVATFHPHDHCAKVPSDAIVRAEQDKAELRVAPNPGTDL